MSAKARLKTLLESGAWEKARRRLEENPLEVLPVAFALANAEDHNLRAAAAKLLNGYLTTNIPLEVAIYAFRLLPRRSPDLAPAAVALTERIKSELEKNGAVDEVVGAELSVNLSERYADLGQFEVARTYAEQAVATLQRLRISGAGKDSSLVMALLTLSKRCLGMREPEMARQHARAAVDIAETLGPDPDGFHDTVLGRALTMLANRESEKGSHADAARLGERAVSALERGDKRDRTYRGDLGLAHHCCANSYQHLGEYNLAAVHGHMAFDLLAPLAHDHVGEHWDTWIASAITYSLALSRLGKAKQSLEKIDVRLGDFWRRAERYPQLYGVDYLSLLISQSAACGEAGDNATGQERARGAIELARKWKEILGEKAEWIEGVALNALFNLEYEARAFAAAHETALQAVRVFEGLGASKPEFREDLTRALRNLTESSRLTASTPEERRQALDTGLRAVASAERLENQGSRQVRLILAHCLSSLSQLQLECGEDAQALLSERRSLGIRRELFNEDQLSFRRDLAYSLRLLSGYEHGAGNFIEALRHVAESIRHYEILLSTTDEDVLTQFGEALFLRAIFLGAKEKNTGMMRSLRRALDRLLPAYRVRPESVKITTAKIAKMYVGAATSFGLAMDHDVDEFRRELLPDDGESENC